MRVLVTGAAGFVGRHLVARLQADHEVIAVVRRLPDHDLGVAKTIVVDLSTPTFTSRLPRDVDAIVHLAQAYKTFPEFAGEILAVNAVSTQRLAEHARSAGIRRFVLASTGSVYLPGYELLRESDVPSPAGFHPATKLMSEQILSFYGSALETLTVRLFAPYGPGQVDRLIPRLIESVMTGTPIALSRGGEPKLQPIFIDDLVELLGQAVRSSVEGVVNVAGDRAVSIRELAELAGSIVGREPVFVDQDRDPPGNLVADTTAMHRAFEVPRLVGIDAGFERTISSMPGREKSLHHQ